MTRAACVVVGLRVDDPDGGAVRLNTPGVAGHAGIPRAVAGRAWAPCDGTSRACFALSHKL
jgi:hypothetical protein